MVVALVAYGCRDQSSASRSAVESETKASRVRVDPAARPLLDAWAEALGGRDRIANLGPIHETGTCTFGEVDGTFEVFTTPRGQLHFGVRVGGGANFTMFDGARAWSLNGSQVTELVGPEVEAQLYPAFLESYSALLLDRRAGAVTYVSSDSVAIQPEGTTQPITITFDASHLPQRFDGPGNRVVQITEWREFRGVKIATAWSSGISVPTDTFRVSDIDHRQTSFVAPTSPAP